MLEDNEINEGRTVICNLRKRWSALTPEVRRLVERAERNLDLDAQNRAEFQVELRNRRTPQQRAALAKAILQSRSEPCPPLPADLKAGGWPDPHRIAKSGESKAIFCKAPRPPRRLVYSY